MAVSPDLYKLAVLVIQTLKEKRIWYSCIKCDEIKFAKFVLLKVDKGKVSMEKGWAHFVPVGHILHKLGLVRQSEKVHVG